MRILILFLMLTFLGLGSYGFAKEQRNYTAICLTRLSDPRLPKWIQIPSQFHQLGERGFFNKPRIVVIGGDTSTGKTFLTKSWLIPTLERSGKTVFYERYSLRAPRTRVDVLVIDDLIINEAETLARAISDARTRLRLGYSTILILRASYDPEQVTEFVSAPSRISSLEGSVTFVDLNGPGLRFTKKEVETFDLRKF